MRRFAAKVAFEFKTTFTTRRRANVFYELRIVTVEARDEKSALRKIERHCERDQWSAAPAPHIAKQTQRFLGVVEVKDLDVLPANEHWYEYVDARPRMARGR